MELLCYDEVVTITKSFGDFRLINWTIKNLSDKLVGYLGEHLKLIVEVDCGNGMVSELNLFIKCIPRFDSWKANYIRELSFFKKEYIMLNELFKEFGGDQGLHKWRPRVVFLKEEVFVFEDLTSLGYEMPKHTDTLTYSEVFAVVEAMARFHAQSYVYEEKKSAIINRPYRIWEDYEQYLQEPSKGQNWRDAGQKAVIDLIKVYSLYKATPNFDEKVDEIVPKLYKYAMELMKPNTCFRNVVVHRDIWANNIFFKKKQNGKLHALIIDYQTVLYCSPMVDLSSMLYFNTRRSFRELHLNKIINFYYNILCQELNMEGLSMDTIFNEVDLLDDYFKNALFGVTQGGIIVPIVAMDTKERDKIFCNPDTCHRVNEISRSEEFIDLVHRDTNYRKRVMELLDEIVEKYVIRTNNNGPIK